MNKNRLLLVLLAIFGLVALAGCGDGGSEEAIKIGAIHDLTGPTSDVGTPYADGIRDYIKFINENGGVNGRLIELSSQDYSYQVPEAEQLYSQYVSEGVIAFQGWGTGDTEALRGKIAEDQIPFMSASYSAGLGKPEEAPYNFLVGTSYSDQFIIALQYAKDNGADNVVIMHHDSPFGTSPVEDGKVWGEANGVAVTSIPMPGGATDFTAELTQVQDVGSDFVVIQNVSSPAATLVKDIDRLNLNIGVVCLNWCSDELFVELAGDAADGVIATSPFAFPGSGAALIENEIRPWAEENGKDLDALGVHYVQGWTTMKVMVDALQIVVENGDDLTGANIKAALETFNNYETGGVTSPLTFTTTDHAGSKSLQLYEVQDGVFVRITDYISAGG